MKPQIPSVETAQKPDKVRVIKISEDEKGAEFKKIEAEWVNTRELIRRNDLGNAIISLEKIKGLQKESELQNMEYISAALLRRANQLLKESKPAEALSLTNIAIDISPDFYPSYYLMGRILWEGNKIKAISSHLAGFKTSLSDFMHAFLRIGDLFLIGIITIFISVFIFFIVTIIKYLPLLQHNLQEVFNIPFIKPYITAISFLIILLPLLFFDPLIAIFIWILFLWLYLSKKEKAITFIFILLIAYSQVVFSFYSFFLAPKKSSTLNAVIQIEKGFWSTDIYDGLIEAIKKDPTNKGAFFALAILSKKRGELDKALAHYQRLTVIDPEYSKAYNNIGNIYFLQRNYDKAIASYQNAIQKDSSLISAYFNLSQAYREKFMFAEGENIFQQARNKNPDLINYYSHITRDNPQQLVIDERVSYRDILSQAFRPYENQESITTKMWNLFEKKVRLEDTTKYAIIVVIIILLLSFLKKSIPVAAYCRECGKVICPRCHRSLLYKGLCSQCLRTFVQIDGIIKNEQGENQSLSQSELSELNRFQKIDSLITRALSVILPGAGHIYGGLTFIGFLYVFTFIFTIFFLIFGNNLIYTSYFLYPERHIIQKALAILSLIIIYSLSLLKIYRSRG
ncbi:MAG: tetratricopeptide repeat protein [Nitrospirae bacterium]|nr:tetratricopeptide repeat protein [Nitrospirota bacterium]